eukprot:Lithocolla_globosa_v1_NODE_1454_length_2564_cov_26.204464.p2 type:complete len:154 gc:universal NODE_1454_length_2564_cov_26.204464:601-140(-)
MVNKILRSTQTNPIPFFNQKRRHLFSDFFLHIGNVCTWTNYHVVFPGRTLHTSSVGKILQTANGQPMVHLNIRQHFDASLDALPGIERKRFLEQPHLFVSQTDLVIFPRFVHCVFHRVLDDAVMPQGNDDVLFGLRLNQRLMRLNNVRCRTFS